jgi:hypothetical protein
LDPITLGLQLAASIPQMINLYKTIQASVSSGQLPPLDTILAQADADWASIAAAAQSPLT